MKEKIKEFWDFLDTLKCNAIIFNSKCFEKAKELQISEKLTNSIINHWTGTEFGRPISDEEIEKIIKLTHENKHRLRIRKKRKS